MTEAYSELERLLYTAYGVELPRLRQLNHRTFRIDRIGGSPLVARKGGGVERIAAVLTYLEQKGHSAARVFPALDGAFVTAVGNEPVIVTSYVEGVEPSFTPGSLEKVGEALGRLHALGRVTGPIPAAPGWIATEPVVEAGMLPDNELKGCSRLVELMDVVSPELQEVCQSMLEASKRLSSFRDHAFVLLHGDCHPWNCVVTPTGEGVYVDWDSAGLGPALIDLGFLLLSADRGPLSYQPVPSDRARLDAVVDGYSRYCRLDLSDLDWLADAIRFRALVFASGMFATEVMQGLHPTKYSGWWERCLASEEIAERARRRFVKQYQ